MKTAKITALSLLMFLSLAVAPKTVLARGLEPRTVFVQLFEWPWNSVAQECETYLGPNGFAAVQVSPPAEHANLGAHAWWERYQPVSYKIESRSGNEEEFKDMIRRCKNAGVDVYVDVVFNHMTAAKQESVGFAGTQYQHYEYPGLYTSNDFHHCGQVNIDYSNQWSIQNCELLGMADIDTGAPNVQDTIAAYLRHVLDDGAAGLRVDAAKHMNANDLAGIYGRIGRTPFIVQEVITGPGEPVSVEPYTKIGHVDVFPWAYGVGMAVRSQDLTSLLQLPSKFGVGTDQAVTLLENHDMERSPSNSGVARFVGDRAQHRLSMVYLLTYPYGYPQLYSGYYFGTDYDQGPPVDGRGYTTQVQDASGNCQAPWTCAHREPGVKELVGFHNRTASQFEATDTYQPKSSILAYGRGPLGHVVMNAGSGAETVRTKTRLPPGHYCNLMDPSQCTDIGADGMMQVTVAPVSAFVVEAP